MKDFERITFDPKIMGGKPCIRGTRVTVGTIVGLVAEEYSFEKILELYPYLEKEDIHHLLNMLPGGLMSLGNPSQLYENFN
ncbi:DUF433 domain-containing protein [Gracilimonas sp.]|uniref:DUF433 domain-containing protein n=1 Tax=Gracilimonas sp. TaxID=1974203 RepID=UPI003D0D26BE